MWRLRTIPAVGQTSATVGQTSAQHTLRTDIMNYVEISTIPLTDSWLQTNL